MKCLVLILCTSILQLQSYCQVEFIATVDATTGTHTVLDSIPEIKYIGIFPKTTTFDIKNNHYIVYGTDASSTSKLYTIDASNGNILYNPLFPVIDSGDNIYCMQFDTSDLNIYALHYDASENLEYLVSVNQTTGIHTKIDTLDGVKYIGSSASYNPTLKHYTFVGIDTNSVKRLYTVDVTTGNILHQPTFPQGADANDQIYFPTWNILTSKLYGVFRDYSEDNTRLATINPTDGTFTTDSVIPNLKLVTISPNYACINENSETFICYGGPTSSNFKLYSIDLNTGLVVDSPSFPILDDPDDNVIEFQFNSIIDTLYALHWDDSLEAKEPGPPVWITHYNQTDFVALPNPAIDRLTIQFNNAQKRILRLYNSMGQELRWWKTQENSLHFQRKDLKSGIYFIGVEAENGEISFAKILFK